MKRGEKLEKYGIYNRLFTFEGEELIELQKTLRKIARKYLFRILEEYPPRRRITTTTLIKYFLIKSDILKDVEDDVPKEFWKYFTPSTLRTIGYNIEAKPKVKKKEVSEDKGGQEDQEIQDDGEFLF